LKAGVSIGDRVTVVGAGSIGLNICAAAKAAGARHVVVAAKTRKRLEYAASVGADAVIATEECDLAQGAAAYHPGGSDIAIDATGSENCIQACLKLVRPGGTVVLAGYGGYRNMQIVMDEVHIKNLRVIGAGNNWNVIEKSLSLLESGRIKTEQLATYLTNLDDWQAALDKTEKRPECFVKSVFVF